MKLHENRELFQQAIRAASQQRNIAEIYIEIKNDIRKTEKGEMGSDHSRQFE